ncbi:hypothetical protein MFTT_15680 [Mycolicibacterium fortuitum subsp. fortuitum]|nr:hypothetical protein MFTT_15680 [Mycolicibacterium fortuitum subsp. fortuitum]
MSEHGAAVAGAANASGKAALTRVEAIAATRADFRRRLTGDIFTQNG